MNRFSLILILAMLMPSVALAENWHWGYNYATVTPTTVAPGDNITVEFEYKVNTDGSPSLWAVFFDGANGAYPYYTVGFKLAEDEPSTSGGTDTFTIEVTVQIPETTEAGQHSINIFSCASSYSPYQQYTFAWYGDPPIMITVEEVNPVIEVGIDIKPGSTPNTINLGSNGVIPVAILSTDTFDATQVDPATVALAGAGVALRGKGTNYLTIEKDVNGDGWIDLEVKVETENLDPGEIQDGWVKLTGSTSDGQEIEGWDQITVVPPE